MGEKNVYVLGELNADLIMTGSDVTPEWNREKVVDSFTIEMGSSSAITACVLAGLGINVHFVSVVGTDQLGDFCIAEIKKKGVNAEYIVQDASLKTGATVALSTEKDRAFLTYMGAISRLEPKYFPDDMLEKADHIHFGSYYLQEKMRPHWLHLFAECQDRGISTSFDLGWDPKEQWHTEDVLALTEHTDLFIPSEDELKEVLGCNETEELLQRLCTLKHRTALKRGAKGSVLLEPTAEGAFQRHELPAFDITPIDTTGAGDSFNAGLIYGFLYGKKGKDLLQFANACGAMATLRIGGASSVPTKKEVEQFITKFSLKKEIS